MAFGLLLEPIGAVERSWSPCNRSGCIYNKEPHTELATNITIKPLHITMGIEIFFQ